MDILSVVSFSRIDSRYAKSTTPKCRGKRKWLHAKWRRLGIPSILLLLWSTPMVPLTGCAVKIPGKGESSHIVILGFGLVTVSDPKEKALTATDLQAFGVTVSDRPGMKLGLGYASSCVVTVADGAEDVRVEVSRKPGGSLVVDTQSAILKQAESFGTRPESKQEGGLR